MPFLVHTLRILEVTAAKMAGLAAVRGMLQSTMAHLVKAITVELDPAILRAMAAVVALVRLGQMVLDQLAAKVAQAGPLQLLVWLKRMALAAVVPSLMNNFIAIFKDTSLVTIVSLYELTGALALALNSDVTWRPFKIAAYLFITG